MTNPDQRFLVPEKINPIEQIDSINSPELRKLLLTHIKKKFRGNRLLIQQAEDIIQTALLKATANISTQQDKQNLIGWLITIVNYTAIDAIRASRPHQRIVDVNQENNLDTIPHPPKNFDQGLIAKDLLEKANRELLNKITHDPHGVKKTYLLYTIKLYQLKKLKGMSYEEIAEDEKININTVKARISEYEKRLKEALNQLMTRSS
jgi:RNA polymerase sigma factor (sigma-70 family)